MGYGPIGKLSFSPLNFVAISQYFWTVIVKHPVFTGLLQAPELTLDGVMWLLDELESITELGDLHSMELAKTNADVRKLHQEIKKNRWKVSLIDSSQGIDTEERDFGKLQV